MKRVPNPTQEQIKARFSYDPKTGLFRHATETKRHKIGDLCNPVRRCGYVMLHIGMSAYLAHRLAWIYQFGNFEEKLCIDHINGVQTDNRIANLRIATYAQNVANSVINRNNTSGFKGVSYQKTSGKWLARIKINGLKRHIGSFDTAEEAGLAYQQASESLHGEFSVSRRKIALSPLWKSRTAGIT